MAFGEECLRFINDPLKIVCMIPDSALVMGHDALERRSTEKEAGNLTKAGSMIRLGHGQVGIPPGPRDLQVLLSAGIEALGD